jgi:Putative restriction endonuclease
MVSSILVLSRTRLILLAPCSILNLLIGGFLSGHAWAYAGTRLGLVAALQEKMRMWLANGAEVAWLIDPSRKAVEVYRPGREAEVLEGGSAVEGDGPVAGFVLELGRVWG